MSDRSERISRDESTDSEIVATTAGDVQGCVTGGIRIFRGIPYGAPTGGAHRFRPPQPVEPWTGVRPARLFGETAPQARTWLAAGGFEGNRPEIGEDCLVLNVHTPGTDDARRPVLVWLHGGGFEAGTGSVMLYDGVNVCRRGDVVVVTLNHRLGLMGHLHLADLAGDDFAGSANAGFLDIVAALGWVRDNIGAFGGDPANVTIYGQSGGGRKVSLATATPIAHGLFHRGAVQSGSHLRLITRERAGELAVRLLDHLGIPRSQPRRLQELPMKELLAANRAVGRRYSPTLDDVVFHRHPWDPDAPATAFEVPMIVGTCRTELSNQLGSMDPTAFAITDDDLVPRLERFVDAADVPELTAIVRRSQPGRDRIRGPVHHRHGAGLLARQRAADRAEGRAGRRRRRPGLVVPHHVADPGGGRSADLPAQPRPALRLRQRRPGHPDRRAAVRGDRRDGRGDVRVVAGVRPDRRSQHTPRSRRGGPTTSTTGP